MAAKVQHPKEYWIEKVQEWLSSGKSARSWCSEHQVDYRNFLLWKRQVSLKPRHQPKGLASSPTNDLGFIELTDRSNTNSGIYLECSDVKIHLSAVFDPLTLSRCLNVIRGGSC